MLGASQTLRPRLIWFERMTPTLETPRLLLSPLALSDAEQIQEIFPHWEIVRYLATQVPWPYPPDGALRYIRDVALPAIERGTTWPWTLRRKSEPSRIVGCIDLRIRENDNRGFWLYVSGRFPAELWEITAEQWRTPGNR
jgi:RimJ/RimL family protein N-acetyltransferase